ncbi:MAG: hypothetical protein ABJN42_04900 [Roseibium sp.]|uniref:hypothetical protein n=1 Tax=Roseibium sp. TaxID=1936156 RepID=UPI0032980B16
MSDENGKPKSPRDIMRLSFDVTRSQSDAMDAMAAECQLEKTSDVFVNAMALMKWAVEETRKGRNIASYDRDNDQLELVKMDALANVKMYPMAVPDPRP